MDAVERSNTDNLTLGRPRQIVRAPKPQRKTKQRAQTNYNAQGNDLEGQAWRGIAKTIRRKENRPENIPTQNMRTEKQ